MKEANIMDTAFIILSPVVFLLSVLLCVLLAVVCGGRKEKDDAD